MSGIGGTTAPARQDVQVFPEFTTPAGVETPDALRPYARTVDMGRVTVVLTRAATDPGVGYDFWMEGRVGADNLWEQITETRTVAAALTVMREQIAGNGHPKIRAVVNANDGDAVVLRAQIITAAA